MRRLVIAIGLSFWAGLAAGFEIEEIRVFDGAPGGPVVSILSTTDTVVFAPVIAAFQLRNPRVGVHYTVSSTQQVYQAIAEDGARFDLVVSSAMDLQMKLANDGLARPRDSPEIAWLPDWAVWREHLFAFSQEPVVVLLRRDAFGDRALPQDRSDLIEAMRDAPALFEGRIGTYDPERSGAGYLFATQDARQSDSFWRLAEVMGSLSPQFYASTAAMVDDLESGDLFAAYNVLGSYVSGGLSIGEAGAVVEMRDFTHVLLRTALIPALAEQPDLGGRFLDFLLSEAGQVTLDREAGLPRINGEALANNPHQRPIRLDTGLLVFIDPLMRDRFLREWTAAVTRP